MKTYTVIGHWLDDEPVVAGVIEGDHPAVDNHVFGGADEPQRWATMVEADDSSNAERLATLEMNGEDEDDEDEPFGSVDVEDDDNERDVRADRIEVGWIVRDYGGDEWRKVANRDDHGDTVLVTFDNGDETTFDTDESIVRKVELT